VRRRDTQQPRRCEGSPTICSLRGSPTCATIDFQLGDQPTNLTKSCYICQHSLRGWQTEWRQVCPSSSGTRASRKEAARSGGQ
jgi:hypothetical protein